MSQSSKFTGIVNEALTRINEISVTEAQEKLTRNVVLIDVREDNEWQKGHIIGATHIGKGVIECKIEQHFPDPSTELVLYCGGGNRSALAADNLQKMGYLHVLSMSGGYKAWVDAGFETTV